MNRLMVAVVVWLVLMTVVLVAQYIKLSADLEKLGEAVKANSLTKPGALFVDPDTKRFYVWWEGEWLEMLIGGEDDT